MKKVGLKLGNVFVLRKHEVEGEKGENEEYE